MSVLDSPLQNGGLILDDPEQTASGLEGVLGTVAVAAFAGVLAISPSLQAQTGIVSVQGQQGAMEVSFEPVGQLGSVDVQGRFAGFEPAAGGLLDGIVDPDGDPLSLEIIAVPPHGTFEWDVNGAFRFTPDAGFIGQTQGQYRVWGGGEASNIETFTIHIDGETGAVTGSVDVSGFAATLEFTYEAMGVLGTVGVTGQQADLQAGQGYVEQAQTGSVSVQGAQGALEGQLQGAPGQVGVAAYAGSLSVAYDGQGLLSTVNVQGFVADLDNASDFIANGVLGAVSVSGFSATFETDNPAPDGAITFTFRGVFMPTRNFNATWNQ